MVIIYEENPKEEGRGMERWENYRRDPTSSSADGGAGPNEVWRTP
jgi:hypothetical protein